MKIPKTFTIGNKTYKVDVRPQISDKNIWGRAHLSAGVILVATHPMEAVEPRPLLGHDGQHQTFWHESTHAILYDMGHKLYRNEAFVEAFSQRLNQMIETAKF
jgi:hypothetical protein